MADADDLTAWRTRDGQRRDRVLAIEAEIRRLREFDDLDKAYPAAIDAYRAASGEPAEQQRHVARHRQFSPSCRQGHAHLYLERWSVALAALAAALPDSPAARRYVDAQRRACYAARQGTLFALARRAGADVPCPEGDSGDLDDAAYFGYVRRNGGSCHTRRPGQRPRPGLGSPRSGTRSPSGSSQGHSPSRRLSRSANPPGMPDAYAGYSPDAGIFVRPTRDVCGIGGLRAGGCMK
ncbi:MAG: hypothetical protein ACRDT0_21760 [Pseudonocardiaceae bacterium]